MLNKNCDALSNMCNLIGNEKKILLTSVAYYGVGKSLNYII